MQFTNQTTTRFGFQPQFRQRETQLTPIWIDYYPESNWSSTGGALDATNYIAYGQTFTTTTTTTPRYIKFYLSITGAPTGEMSFGLWSTTGAAGSEVPLASLAESDIYDPAAPINGVTLSGTPQLVTIPLLNPVAISAGTYAVICYFGEGDGSNFVLVGNDNSSPTHSGHRVGSLNVVTWTTSSSVDVIFYVY